MSLNEKITVNGYLIVNKLVSDSHLEMLDKECQYLRTLSLNERKNLFHNSSVTFEILREIVMSLGSKGLKMVLTKYCFYLEKNYDNNWPLPLHQDVNFPAYLNLTEKEKIYWYEQGMWVRCNLDDNDERSGALRIVKNSHTLGRIQDNKCSHYNSDPIVAQRGDVILFKPLLIHGSLKMEKRVQRRVIQAFVIPSL